MVGSKPDPYCTLIVHFILTFQIIKYHTLIYKSWQIAITIIHTLICEIIEKVWFYTNKFPFCTWPPNTHPNPMQWGYLSRFSETHIVSGTLNDHIRIKKPWKSLFLFHFLQMKFSVCLSFDVWLTYLFWVELLTFAWDIVQIAPPDNEGYHYPQKYHIWINRFINSLCLRNKHANLHIYINGTCILQNIKNIASIKWKVVNLHLTQPFNLQNIALLPFMHTTVTYECTNAALKCAHICWTICQIIKLCLDFYKTFYFHEILIQRELPHFSAITDTSTDTKWCTD